VYIKGGTMNVDFKTVELAGKNVLIAIYEDGRVYKLTRMLSREGGGHEWWDEWHPMPSLPE